MTEREAIQKLALAIDALAYHVANHVFFDPAIKGLSSEMKEIHEAMSALNGKKAIEVAARGVVEGETK